MKMLAAVGLFLVLASCRHDTTRSADDQSFNITAAPPPKSVEAAPVPQPAAAAEEVASECTKSDEEEDPLAGMPPEMLKQLAEAEAALAGEKLAGPCITCHVDQVDEYVGGLHQKEKVSCADCHGSSEAHVEDENNNVKPDQLFFRENTDRRCGECHEDDCTRPPEYKPPIVIESQPTICTDCHGRHDVKLIK